jgi:hypothetical protein
VATISTAIQHMPRAKTGERAADAGAEAAQPFEPRGAALRQGAGKARNLRGGWFARLKTERRHRAGGGAAEYCRAGRIGPQHAGRVRAPQPYRQRAQGMGRETWIAQAGNWDLSFVHFRHTQYG